MHEGFSFHQDGGWHFTGTRWVENHELLNGLLMNPGAKWPLVYSTHASRLHDLNQDGLCELIVSRDNFGHHFGDEVIFTWSAKKNEWIRLPFTLPAGVHLFNPDGKDNGVRFVDIDGDG